MKPSTLANFEKELSKAAINMKDYPFRSTKIYGAYGDNVDFTIEHDSNREIGCICNSCYSVIRMCMYNHQIVHLGNAQGFDPQSHQFDVHPRISGFCPVCHKYQDSFNIYNMDIALIVSILKQKVNKMDVLHVYSDRCLKLMIQYNDDHYSNNGSTIIDNFLRGLPITWDMETFGTTRDGQGTYCTIYLEKCNYVEGIYDMLKYVKNLPVSYTRKIPYRYHPQIMNIINHPYII